MNISSSTLLGRARAWASTSRLFATATSSPGGPVLAACLCALLLALAAHFVGKPPSGPLPFGAHPVVFHAGARPVGRAPRPHPQAAPQTIYVRNVSKLIGDQEILNALPAFQAAVSEDFGPYWRTDVKLVFIGRGPVPRRGETITVTDYVDCLFCLGYHEVWRGVPRGFVWSSVGLEWQVTFTHELFEMLSDPLVDRFAHVGRRFYILESADPVEAFYYLRPGANGASVRISDFVTEEWFIPGARGPYDFMRLVKKPLELLKGGYISWLEDGVWGHADKF